MPYFILGLAVLIGIILIVRGFRGMNRQTVRKAMVVIVTLAAVAVIVVIALSGRLGMLGWVLFLLPALFRWRQMRQMMKNMGGPSPGRNSDVETRYLRMTLEHDSGVLRGVVLDGAHMGRNLDEMPLDDLLDLLRECRINDSESATILESYLDRVHGADWRGASGAGAGSGGDAHGGSAGGGAMSRNEAYEILGLKPGVSPEEIRTAHRTLLKANHPDRGGSTWLAAQINRAKDVLLPDE